MIDDLSRYFYEYHTINKVLIGIYSGTCTYLPISIFFVVGTLKRKQTNNFDLIAD